MTQAGAKKHSEVIYAFCDGETIQWRNRVDGEWYDDDKPSFSEQYEYRKKPKPRVAREWDINEREGWARPVMPHESSLNGCVRVREVLPGEDEP